jgi:hypothetical protein
MDSAFSLEPAALLDTIVDRRRAGQAPSAR